LSAPARLLLALILPMVLLASPLAAEAQRGGKPCAIGWLASFPWGTSGSRPLWVFEFVEALRQTGWLQDPRVPRVPRHQPRDRTGQPAGSISTPWSNLAEQRVILAVNNPPNHRRLVAKTRSSASHRPVSRVTLMSTAARTSC
jgi:hypothetical protein